MHGFTIATHLPKHLEQCFKNDEKLWECLKKWDIMINISYNDFSGILVFELSTFAYNKVSREEFMAHHGLPYIIMRVEIQSHLDAFIEKLYGN